MSQLFTVGCSTHSIENFLKLLKIHKVNSVVDVRSVPFSAYTNQFNKDNISAFCMRNSIFYMHMGREFGAQREEKDLYSHDNKGYYVDFSKVANASVFLSGIDRILNGLRKGYNIALMCTEKDPIDCHRAILVARNFAIRNTDVKHILFDGSLLNQNELNDRLVKLYNSKQDIEMDLFHNDNSKVGEKDDMLYNALTNAYKLRGIEIAFRKDYL